MTDNVNHPRHYNQYKGVEVIDLAEQMNFNRGNAVKYICRAGYKDAGNLEKEIEDLAKAAFYINREIERLKKGVEDTPKNHEWINTELEKNYWNLTNREMVVAFRFDGRNTDLLDGAFGGYMIPEGVEPTDGVLPKALVQWRNSQIIQEIKVGDWVLIAPHAPYAMGHADFVHEHITEDQYDHLRLKKRS